MIGESEMTQLENMAQSFIIVNAYEQDDCNLTTEIERYSSLK